MRKLESLGGELHFVYEAGPCGFWIQRLIAARGHECWVVSPSSIPKKSGERIKTDRRDSEKIARMARAGELDPIYVPAEIDEAIRDLVRARDDAIIAQRRARQQLKTLLLRNEIRYVGKCSWTAAHRQWIARLKLPQPAQQIAFEEYVDAVEVATGRVERITRATERSTEGWRFAPVVATLQALRGVQFVHAVTRDIAWKAQLRLCARFRRLCARRLNKNTVVVAIARELSGFVWATAKDVKLD